MLDSSLCRFNQDAVFHWTELSWRLFNWLAEPWRVFLILATIMAVPWALRWRWKRRITRAVLVVGLIYCALISPVAVALGNRVMTAFIPNDSGQIADAAVLLGRGGALRRDRVSVAAELWQTNRTSLFFASGKGDAPFLANLLVAAGIPGDKVDGEPCSRTTEENAQFTANMLKPRGVKKIVLITDPPHMVRSILTFRSLGFEVVPHTTTVPHEVTTAQEAVLLLREYIGLVSYSLKGRFSPREPVANNIVESQPLHKVVTEAVGS